VGAIGMDKEEEEKLRKREGFILRQQHEKAQTKTHFTVLEVQ
jgi:hypothetical protein